LALAMVAEDHGAELAREVARWLVVYLHRPGGQSQFSAPSAAAVPERSSLRALQVWLEENVAGDLSLGALAERAGMSTRHFSRVFAAEIGTTPARYVERVRVGAARRLLETTDQPMDRLASTVGLGSPDTLYRIFHRHLGIAPGEYRARFADR
jgi:transcriptional regulator GlxA family with amidase domain